MGTNFNFDFKVFKEILQGKCTPLLGVCGFLSIDLLVYVVFRRLLAKISKKSLKNAKFVATLQYGDFSTKASYFGREPNWLRSDVSGNTDFAGLQCIDLRFFRHLGNNTSLQISFSLIHGHFSC